MEHQVFNIQALNGLRESLRQQPAPPPDACSVMLIYTSLNDPGWLAGICQVVQEYLPGALIAGCNCPAVIDSSYPSDAHTIASLLTLTSSSAEGHLIAVKPGEEYSSGSQLARTINDGHEQDPKGILLLLPPTLLDCHSLLKGVSSGFPLTPLFGGGAGDGDDIFRVQLMLNGQSEDCGLLAIAFYGEQLRLKTYTYLGWIPFGERMTVTSAKNNEVRTINHKSAAELYNHFIGYDQHDFFAHAMEFPFILKRGRHEIARVPFLLSDDNNMQFVADIGEGDQLQFAYGDINTMLDSLGYCQRELNAFQPQAVLVYSCISRLNFLQENVGLEISPYSRISPAAGFFTYGEVDTLNYGDNILNATIVSVALSEDPPLADKSVTLSDDCSAGLGNRSDLARLKRLMHFISKMTEKLQQANEELRIISEKDALTGIYNRRSFMLRLRQETETARQNHSPLALVMIDIDYFKNINDKLGHQAGDQVLIEITHMIATELRATDFLARYGGEEFVLILPCTEINGARAIAERIRQSVELRSQEIQGMPAITCSLGVAWSLQGGMPPESLISKADKALYEAKGQGRNRVVTDA